MAAANVTLLAHADVLTATSHGTQAAKQRTLHLTHTACWLLQLLPQVLQLLQQEGSMELHREQQQEDSLGMQLGDAHTFHV
jgi:hypothetical protein